MYNKKSGFTLLFAVLVSTLVVSIGATIISIALRQTILSSTSRESQFAFYAANTALDCAHYWDTFTGLELGGKVVFPSPLGEESVEEGSSEAALITCSGVNIITGSGNDDKGWESDSGTDYTEKTFYLKIADQVGITELPEYSYCATVTIKKTDNSPNIDTVIEVKGYNTCIETNVRRVERSLTQEYRS